MKIPNIIERMKHLEHFKGLSPSELMEIVKAGQIKKYPVETYIFFEGDPCDGLFVLFSGQVNLSKLSPEGQENIIAVVNPVIMFNEVAAIDCGPNPYTAVTCKNSIIWRINCETFQYGMERYPKIAIGLLPVLAARNRWLISQYADLSFLSVRSRTAKLLLELSDNGQRVIDRRNNSINEMAARVATVPEAISRSLKILKDRGVIDSTRRKITINQPDELIKSAQLDEGFFKTNF